MVADLTSNLWNAGYQNNIAGSFISSYGDYRKFRTRLDHDANVYIIYLCATKRTRDTGRIVRDKETSEEWRDMVDPADPEDSMLRRSDVDYRHVHIENDTLSVAETVLTVQRAIADVYGLIGSESAGSD